MSNLAVAVDEKRSTILHKLATNCDALTDLKERLTEVEDRLYSPRPQPINKPGTLEGDKNVEALVDTQAAMILVSHEIAIRILNRLV